MTCGAFVGRDRYLSKLQSIIPSEGRADLTAVYGRRRIGKTRLVHEAYGHGPLLEFEGLEGAGSAEQKTHFVQTLARLSGEAAHRLARPGDWAELLMLLADHVSGQPSVIFLDEFQWMAAGRSDLVAKLKYVWDSRFSRTGGVHLVLCGSVSSFLVKKVIRSSALYGRIDHIINLGPLRFDEAQAGFFPERSVLEALEYYLVMGGIPKYLEMYDPRRPVRIQLSEQCFSPGGYFLDEFERIFTSHFGRQHSYRSIIEHLAGRRFASREQIARHLGLGSGGRVSEYLEDLTLAGFIEAYGSVHNPAATGLKRYRIADPYLRFYFRFIHPLRARIGRSAEGVPLHLALPERRYEVYLGLAFESFCHQHADRIAELLGFSAVAYESGSWFKKKDLTSGAQIDLLFKRADNVVTLCEVKHRRRVTRSVIGEVQAKADALQLGPGVTIEKVLISAFPPEGEVLDEGYFSRILTAEDFSVAPRTRGAAGWGRRTIPAR